MITPKRVAPNRNTRWAQNDPWNYFTPDVTLSHGEVVDQLLRHSWKFARTMPQWPHDYTLRENWRVEGMPWENLVQYLRDYSYQGWFGAKRTPRLYWVHGGYIYWTMGSPLHDTILINRAVNEITTYHHVAPRRFERTS